MLCFVYDLFMKLKYIIILLTEFLFFFNIIVIKYLLFANKNNKFSKLYTFKNYTFSILSNNYNM